MKTKVFFVLFCFFFWWGRGELTFFSIKLQIFAQYGFLATFVTEKDFASRNKLRMKIVRFAYPSKVKVLLYYSGIGIALLGWFSSRTATSVDDCARKSNNWLDQWQSCKLRTGSRIQSFPRAFPSSNDFPVLLLNQPNKLSGAVSVANLLEMDTTKTLAEVLKTADCSMNSDGHKKGVNDYLIWYLFLNCMIFYMLRLNFILGFNFISQLQLLCHTLPFPKTKGCKI